MTDTERSLPAEEALKALQERAKELSCLYRIDEILGRFDKPSDELFTEIV